ncbi:MAG: chromophore lyase CpcT/CpeT [Thermoanaerobaculia bacterium]|nr:chromophore lyase CpcT/CpeT [Thermoanaerobaculia bacterium]
MRARRAAAAACLFAVGPVALAESRAAEVAAWLTGTFEAKDPAAGGGAVRIVIVSVPKSRIANGAPVLYREQAVAPKLDEPSLQRFYRLEEDGEVVRLRAFDPRDPLIVRGKWRDPSTLALYGANDVRERPGCEIALKRVGERWEGGTPEATPQAACPSSLRNAVRMTSSVTLSKDELVQRDRGFDEKGRQTWDSREGGATFVKRSASAPVDGALVERTVGRRPEAKEKDSLKVKEEEKEKEASLKVNEGEAQAPPVLIVTGPSPPSKKYNMTELRALAGSERLPVSRLFPSKEVSAASVIVVTSRNGSVSVFSSAEISSSSSSSDGPFLDVSSGAPRLVAAGGRGLDDVVSVELRVLAPAK